MIKRLGGWVEDRTGIAATMRHLLDEQIEGGARWAYVFGSALTIILGIQVVTGVLLMTAYSPAAHTAWPSVWYIQHRIGWGWLVRGVHHYGAQAMVIVLAFHLVQVSLYGAYKKPREINWWLGLGLMGATLGLALTGYLLPWDQKGYWATRVATNIAGGIPLVGGAIQTLLQGGPEYGHATLTRFFALHVAILPGALFALLFLHVALFRRHGVTPPAGADRSRIEPFWPHQLAKDVIAGIVVFAAILAVTLATGGAPLDAPADPASEYPARPEWYFLGLFQLLKYFEGPLELVGTVVLPGLVGA
ncbi:MAG: cytochrome bc complex cytochrome b subunit, partial [Deltaproteobacteria bacterium]|nr:cytochrome bc complex cytochrome b subunit [Deltaproteobacteria bacterium]